MNDDPLSLSTEQQRRIHVVGTSGCGKSTLASELAKRLNYPHVELDRLHWLPNWQEEDNDRYRQKLRAAIAEPQWVLDGNYYSKSVDIQWATGNGATAVIWCDLSFPRTLARACRRALQRAWNQEEVWPGTGNRESFRKLFTHDSVVLWTMISFRHNRRRYTKIIEEQAFPHIKFVRLSNPRQVSLFLKQFELTLER